MTNTKMMDMDSLPDQLLIIGVSFIALEFAQMCGASAVASSSSRACSSRSALDAQLGPEPL